MLDNDNKLSADQETQFPDALKSFSNNNNVNKIRRRMEKIKTLTE